MTALASFCRDISRITALEGGLLACAVATVITVGLRAASLLSFTA